MTNLKSILLGTGAAIVAATSAQAADLPVVEPVDYVQICDLYGDGFYYMPGTNTCLGISGFVRFEARFNSDDAPGDAFVGNPFALGVANRGFVTNTVGGTLTPAGTVFVRGDTTDNVNFGYRGRVIFDTRTETELGTLRGFIQMEAGTAFSNDDQLVDLDLAYIQFNVGPALMTAGLAPSLAGVQGPSTLMDTAFASGGGDAPQLAFNFEFGPVSAGIAIVDPAQQTSAAVFDGFVVGSPVLSITPTSFFNQDALGQDLPYLEAELNFELGGIDIQTGYALGRVEGRVDGFDSVTGLYIEREFDEIGYAIAGSANANIGGFKAGIGGSYSHGMTDYGADAGPFQADYRIGVPFGVLPATTAGGAFNQLDIDLVDAWSIYGQIGADIGQFQVNLVGTYGEVEYPTFQNGFGGSAGARTINGGDNVEAFTVSLNAAVAPVDGLTISGEVFYSDVEVDRNVNSNTAVLNNRDGSYDADTFGAIFRMERKF